MADHSDLLVPRPLRALGAAPAGTGSKAAFVAAPATAAYLPGGAWPEELRELFAHVCSIPSAGENIRASECQHLWVPVGAHAFRRVLILAVWQDGLHNGGAEAERSCF